MNEPRDEQPKIVVDTDWKAQVEAEKERLRREEQPKDESPAAEQLRGAAHGGAGEERLPPASFALLVTSLATQAMVALGQIPDPFEDKPVVRLLHARHHIDMLGVLEEKTQGNLTPEEQSLLAHVLTDLRVAYVAVESRVKRAEK